MDDAGFAALLRERGLIADDVLAREQAAHTERAYGGEAVSLADHLVERGLLSPELRAELAPRRLSRPPPVVGAVPAIVREDRAPRGEEARSWIATRQGKLTIAAVACLAISLACFVTARARWRLHDGIEREVGWITDADLHAEVCAAVRKRGWDVRDDEVQVGYEASVFSETAFTFWATIRSPSTGLYHQTSVPRFLPAKIRPVDGHQFGSKKDVWQVSFWPTVARWTGMVVGAIAAAVLLFKAYVSTKSDW